MGIGYSINSCALIRMNVGRVMPSDFATRALTITPVGSNLKLQFGRFGYFIDKILKGTKPGDIPIEEPTAPELAAFATGRDFSAWIGLVPRQMSTGDRTILGRISKRGNGYLRTLFMQAARVILLRPASWPKHGFGIWLARAAQRLHPNILAAALANKLARIAWTVLAQERSYEARIMKAAA